MEWFNNFFVLLLIAATAFFVASEFAIVAIRKPTITSMVAEGKRGAKQVLKVTQNMNDYLAACQLGNTLAALAMGWIGEDTMRDWLEPFFYLLPIPEALERPIAVFTSFITITFLNVVLGELAPKTLTIQSTERVALFVARPLIYWYYVTFPLNWLLNHSANLIARLFGAKNKTEIDQLTPTELKIIFEDSYKQGLLNSQEFRYMNNIFQLNDVPAQEVMTPRTEVVAIDQTATVQDLLQLTTKHTYHIFPVTANNDKDKIVGILPISQVTAGLGGNTEALYQPVSSFMSPVVEVFAGIILEELIIKMQQKGVTFVVLTDEYGGTSGIITLEDIMEVIVGDMEEANQPKGVRQIAKNHYMIAGSEPLVSVEEVLGIRLDSSDVHTISGYLLLQKFDLDTGYQLIIDDWEFTVSSMNKNSIRQVEVKRR
ncbi:hemolysin family protein [Listeria sp. PSOL-1]|uniref:hemolysin family protein n=1 Tax=Listeria sp. PSOL-1 TaxID=1844999 RepID=UPI00351B188D